MAERKKKGCKNNIFIINVFIHEVIESKKTNPYIVLEQALSDWCDAGVNDDALEVYYKADKYLQGGKWGSILASVQLD